MKKMLSHASMIAFCAMLMACVMTGCKDQNAPTPTPEPTPEPVDTVAVAALYKIELSVGADMLSVFDVAVEYYDENGAKQILKYDTTAISKTIISKGLPATLGSHLSISAKEGLDTTVVKEFVINFKYQYETYSINAEGKDAGIIAQSSGINGDTNFPINMLEKWLTSAAKETKKAAILFVYNEKGKFTENEWE